MLNEQSKICHKHIIVKKYTVKHPMNFKGTIENTSWNNLWLQYEKYKIHYGTSYGYLEKK